MQEKIFTFLHPPVTPFFFLQTAKGLTHRSELVRQGSSGPGLTHGAKFAGTGACRICRAYEGRTRAAEAYGDSKRQSSFSGLCLFYFLFFALFPLSRPLYFHPSRQKTDGIAVSSSQSVIKTAPVRMKSLFFFS